MPSGLSGITVGDLRYIDCMLHHRGLCDSCAKQDKISSLVTPWVIFYAIAVVASLVAIFMKIGVFIQQLRCRNVWSLKFSFSYCWMRIMVLKCQTSTPTTPVAQLRQAPNNKGMKKSHFFSGTAEKSSSLKTTSMMQRTRITSTHCRCMDVNMHACRFDYLPCSVIQDAMHSSYY